MDSSRFLGDAVLTSRFFSLRAQTDMHYSNSVQETPTEISTEIKQNKKKNGERTGFAMQLQITSSFLQINLVSRHSPATAPKMLRSD